MDAADIEAANRLRIAMGMKPLPVPGGASSQPKAKEPSPDEDPSGTFEGRQAQAYDNFKKLREAEAAKKNREERAAAVKKARELAQRNAVLEGKGLGEADGDGDLDAKSWLKGQKKRLKKIDKVRKAEEDRAKAEVEADAARSYSSKDLAGVRVGHDMSSLLDDGEQVLTLKDTTVLENEEEGDELENADLRDQEKLEERLKLKKKKPIYDPNDIDDTGGHTILSQYDEEISGKKRKAFTLDAQGTLGDLAEILDAPREKANVQNLDLDVLDAPASDYLDISEIKVKKPKKKKSKSTRKRVVDDEDALFPADAPEVDNGEMDIDSGNVPTHKKRKTVDEPLVDDEDLQATLAAQRRDALKKRKPMRPQDIAKQLREEANNPDPESEAPAGGLVIDEISEFVGALKNSNDDEERQRPDRRKTPQPQQPQPVTAMDDESEDDEDTEMANAKHEYPEELEHDHTSYEGLTTTGVDEEKTVAQGMGATLQMLRERGLIEEAHGADLNTQFRDHQQFLVERNRRLAKIEEDARRQRERDRASGVLDRMSTWEREEYSRKQNAQRDLQASRILSDMFNRGYTPTFDIKYTDEHGRRLDQKEAFKHLSHQFHGKGSGKGKTDKLLKKIDSEKRREAQSILDNSKDAGMGSAQPKKRKEAGVRLA